MSARGSGFEEQAGLVSSDLPNSRIQAGDYSGGSMSVPSHDLNDSRLFTWMHKVREKSSIAYFYLYPVTIGLCYSVSCFAFQTLNFPFTLGLFLLTVIGIPVCLATVPVMCIGAVLLYLLWEILLLTSWLEIVMTYYMVENDVEYLTDRAPDIVPSLHSRYLPKCHNFCQSGNRCRRPKFLFTSSRTYVIVLYNLFIKPCVTLVTCVWVLLPMISISYLCTPIMYVAHPNWFKKGKYCYGNPSGNNCHGWGIDSGGDVFALFLIGLFSLPLCLALNNFMAGIAKRVTYYFLTDVSRKPPPSRNGHLRLDEVAIPKPKNEPRTIENYDLL